MSGEEPTYDNNGSFSSTDNKFSINFSKAKTKFYLSIHYNGDNGYLFVNGKVIYKFKANNKTSTLTFQLCIGSISKKIDKNGSKKYLMKEICIIFQ